ncbi:MAG TPA: flagellar basal body P-ring protein FlgI [Opitutaceae bacterium]|nr:flagellar basal body P-ring protein FlgI [Opitutaceae bacterium]
MSLKHLFGVLLLLAAALPLARADGSRLKDLVVVEGGRDNQLIGYGIVAGLAGDGDKNSEATLRSIANTLEHFGISIPASTLKSSNAAAVLVTADIGPFLKPGARIDVTVAALGEAKSLQGGVLFQTPLLGADGAVYAVAQGPVAVGGFLGGGGGPGGATVQKNHPTVASITNGAIVEREIPATVVRDGVVRLLLHQPDFATAARIADAVNAQFPGTARAQDAATVAVGLPAAFAGNEVSFIASLGAIEARPDTAARVVLNERTGTIVATSAVRLSQVAISHGSLTIKIASTLGVSQPGPFSEGGTTAVVPSTRTDVTEVKGGFQIVEEMPSVEELAKALNALGVSSREMMAIFQSLKRAGALQAEVVIN